MKDAKAQGSPGPLPLDHRPLHGLVQLLLDGVLGNDPPEDQGLGRLPDAVNAPQRLLLHGLGLLVGESIEGVRQHDVPAVQKLNPTQTRTPPLKQAAPGLAAVKVIPELCSSQDSIIMKSSRFCLFCQSIMALPCTRALPERVMKGTSNSRKACSSFLRMFLYCTKSSSRSPGKSRWISLSVAIITLTFVPYLL